MADESKAPRRARPPGGDHMSDIEATVAMAWDAFRLALFMKTRTYPPAEVLRWIAARGPTNQPNTPPTQGMSRASK